MLRKTIAVVGLLLTTLAHGQDVDSGKAVLNAELESTLSTTYGEQPIKGRLSAYFRVDPANLDAGLVAVGGMNLLYTDVPQELLSGSKLPGKNTGGLGFSIDASEATQFLKYNPQDATLEGVVNGRITYSLYPKIEAVNRDKQGDDFDGIAQQAQLQL